MAPSPWPDDLTSHEVEVMLDLVERTVVDATGGRTSTPRAVESLPTGLQHPRGVFVTLTVDGELNGCIGSIAPAEPLGHAVARLGLAAAFDDPRLPALRRQDLPGLAIEVSLLTRPTPLPVGSWAELAVHVRPGRDGVILRAGRRQGLFLPAVWDQLPHPHDFLDQLYVKAGLAPRSWPGGMEAHRFEAVKHRRQMRAAA